MLQNQRQVDPPQTQSVGYQYRMIKFCTDPHGSPLDTKGEGREKTDGLPRGPDSPE